MAQGPVLSRRARGTAAVVCGLLALVVAAAITKDLIKVGPRELLWSWSVVQQASFAPAERLTSLADGELLVLYAAGALAAWRAPAAGAYFAAVAALTVVPRAVILWSLLTHDIYARVWTFPEGKWAILSLAGYLVLGFALLVTALAGREPADHSFGPALGTPSAAPRRGNAVAAFLLLGAAACLTAGWQLWWLNELGWDLYKTLLTGERTVASLTQPPGAVMAWTLCALLAVAALAVVNQAPAGRLLGMTGGWLMLTGAVAQLVLYVDRGLLLDFPGAGTSEVLQQLTMLFELVAGPTVLLLLLPKEAARPWQLATGPARGYGWYT